MSKYIEIDELISAIKTAPVWTGLDAIERIKTLSTIDIVRCKECKWDKAQMIPKEVKCIYQHDADDYCSYGERREP